MKKPPALPGEAVSKFQSPHQPAGASGGDDALCFYAISTLHSSNHHCQGPSLQKVNEMGTLIWVKSTENQWLGLDSVNLNGVTSIGVYIIWHGGPAPRTVRVGQVTSKQGSRPTGSIPPLAHTAQTEACGLRGQLYHSKPWMALNAISPRRFGRWSGTVSRRWPRFL